MPMHAFLCLGAGFKSCDSAFQDPFRFCSCSFKFLQQLQTTKDERLSAIRVASCKDVAVSETFLHSTRYLWEILDLYYYVIKSPF